MVRDVFVEIGEDEQELEHPVALFGVGLGSGLFQVLDDGERVGEQPLESLRVNRVTHAAALQSAVRANEGFIEEVIETKLLACQGPRDRSGTQIPFAGS